MLTDNSQAPPERKSLNLLMKKKNFYINPFSLLQNVDHKCKYRSKKGLLPFVEINGEELPDSNMIIETLAKKFDKEMPAQLSQDQKNVQHAMIAMVENHLHW